jgi:ubiquinone/menaquinone biosynthesis C-methylase UbiE
LGDSLSKSIERFQGYADRYADFRPAYPEPLLRALACSILEEPPAGGVVADIGSGTGIFSRQLRALLPAGTAVVGIEPASDMRRKAEAMSAGIAGLFWREGFAEHIPLAAGSARAVVAATAAHWFDRPKFFAEARRVLAPRGLLAIVEYVRDEENSPAAAVVAFLGRHGGPRAHARPDYPAELSPAAGFRDYAHSTAHVTLSLSPEAFTGLALSSSHARAAIETFGEQPAAEMLLETVGHLVSVDGHIPYRYLFHLFTIRAERQAP